MAVRPRVRTPTHLMRGRPILGEPAKRPQSGGCTSTERVTVTNGGVDVMGPMREVPCYDADSHCRSRTTAMVRPLARFPWLGPSVAALCLGA